MFTREKIEAAVFWYLIDVLPMQILVVVAFLVGFYMAAPEVCS